MQAAYQWSARKEATTDLTMGKRAEYDCSNPGDRLLKKGFAGEELPRLRVGFRQQRPRRHERPSP